MNLMILIQMLSGEIDIVIDHKCIVLMSLIDALVNQMFILLYLINYKQIINFQIGFNNQNLTRSTFSSI